MSKRKLSLRRLFSNNKFLVVFSIVVAIVFWIVVALEYAPVVDNIVENVPVKIDIENSVPDKLGLQVFGNNEYTVDITVRGNRYDIGGDLITADDFDVVAQTAYVNSSGNHTLKIKASLKDADADYEITSISSEYIEVYFDKYEEKEVEVSTRIVSDLAAVTDEDYLFDEDEIIITTQSVTVSGAKTEVDKVTGAFAEIIIKDKLTESVTFDAEIKLESIGDEELKHIKLNGENQLTVPVTLPVYKIQTLPVSVAFKNSPTDYINSPLSYTCTPAQVRVAVMQNGSQSDDTLEVGTIDFNEISADKTIFDFKASELVDVKVLDGTTNFKIKINLTDLVTQTYTINPSNITLTGVENANSVDVSVENAGRILVSGQTADLAKISADDILGTINLSSVDVSSRGNRVPVTVSLKVKNNCWITGTYYAVVRTK